MKRIPSIFQTKQQFTSFGHNKRKTTSFGSLPHQRTPGILLYSNPGQEITIKYMSSTTDTTEQSETLTLSKSYAEITDNSIDLPLIGGAP
jgi:hypothetical protein